MSVNAMDRKTYDSLDSAISDLVAANRILAHHGVLDTFGHISVRNPLNPDTFFLATYHAPSLVTRADIALYAVSTAEPVLSTETRKVASEVHIHAGLLRARPELSAVLHCHAPILVSFSILPPSRRTELKPVIHVGASTGKRAPVYDIAANNGSSTDLLIRTPALGDDLATTFKKNGGCGMVLMRGHGATIVSAHGVRDLTHKGIYAVVNANILKDARLMCGQTGARRSRRGRRLFE